MLSQLPPGVVQRLVERAAVRVQPLGQDVDRDAVDGQCNEDTLLVRRQYLGNRALESLDQLVLLGLGIGQESGAREQAPALWLERHFPPLPGTFSQLDGRFEQGELVCPGREATQAAEVVETPQYAHQRVVRGFGRDVFELVAAQVR